MNKRKNVAMRKHRAKAKRLRDRKKTEGTGATPATPATTTPRR